jgi:uncharacterized protein (DUF4415 family)
LLIQFDFDPVKWQINIDKHMTETSKNTSIHTLGGISPNSKAIHEQEKAIDYSDIPELSNAWFQQAKRASQLPEKKQVSLRIDEDILEFFKRQGSRYQTKMHAVLRAYVDGNKSIGKK